MQGSGPRCNKLYFVLATNPMTQFTEVVTVSGMLKFKGGKDTCESDDVIAKTPAWDRPPNPQIFKKV
eukprot:2330041-Amphidinium_carterae.1